MTYIASTGCELVVQHPSSRMTSTEEVWSRLMSARFLQGRFAAGRPLDFVKCPLRVMCWSRMKKVPSAIRCCSPLHKV